MGKALPPQCQDVAPYSHLHQPHAVARVASPLHDLHTVLAIPAVAVAGSCGNIAKQPEACVATSCHNEAAHGIHERGWNEGSRDVLLLHAQDTYLGTISPAEEKEQAQWQGPDARGFTIWEHIVQD